MDSSGMYATPISVGVSKGSQNGSCV